MITAKFNDRGDLVWAWEPTGMISINNINNIKDINIIVPNKVVEVIFINGTKEKMICHDDDEFDIRKCLFIALAKRLYKNNYTFEGIEFKAQELMYQKKYVKIVDSALKNYERKQRESTKLEANYKAEQERIEKKRAKKLAYKKRRDARREQADKEKQIEIQKEAYIRAMNEMREKDNKAV